MSATCAPSPMRCACIRCAIRAARICRAPTPGAHVDLRLPGGQIRQYSLCGDPDDDTVYTIAVKREDDGRGASRWIHDNLRVGCTVRSRRRATTFRWRQAERHVFIAGGIGITPILPMVRHLARRNIPFDLHYCAHDAARARRSCRPSARSAARERLINLFLGGARAAERRGSTCESSAQAVTPGTHVYCCGPQRLTRPFARPRNNWPAELRSSRSVQADGRRKFRAGAVRRQARLDRTRCCASPPDKSALDVLRAHGVALPSSCEFGVCGACACRYVDGTVIHRDSVLDITARQKQMMLCVSRARVSVTLDL